MRYWWNNVLPAYMQFVDNHLWVLILGCVVICSFLFGRFGGFTSWRDEGFFASVILAVVCGVLAPILSIVFVAIVPFILPLFVVGVVAFLAVIYGVKLSKGGSWWNFSS